MTDTLFYDGQCPLCVKEMDRLRQLKSSTLELQDIHALDDLAVTETLESTRGDTQKTVERAPEHVSTTAMPSKTALLKVLHLQRDGQFITGIDANIAAWQHTRYGWLWRWLSWPIIRPIVEIVYDRWAKWRYDRLYTR